MRTITYDADAAEGPQEGDALLAPRTGNAWLVTASRPVRSVLHPRRHRLEVERLPPPEADEVREAWEMQRSEQDPPIRVWSLVWNRRKTNRHGLRAWSRSG